MMIVRMRGWEELVKTLYVLLFIVSLLWIGAFVSTLIAHDGQMFKNKSYAFKNHADQFSLSMNNENVIGINRNGTSIFQMKNWCELKPPHTN
jgi:hypothetical protein